MKQFRKEIKQLKEEQREIFRVNCDKILFDTFAELDNIKEEIVKTSFGDIRIVVDEKLPPNIIRFFKKR